jgi:putative monooxygenase
MDETLRAVPGQVPGTEPVHARQPDRPVGLVHSADLPPDVRRGGEIRTLLSPRTVGSVSGFLGRVDIAPGERIAEHYHPYSEEFIYLVAGDLAVDLDGEPRKLAPGDALLIPPGTRHRLRNVGTAPVQCVFHVGPLAPRPELGHVDTETDGGPGSVQ